MGLFAHGLKRKVSGMEVARRGLPKRVGANGQGNGDRDSGMEAKSSVVPLGSSRASCHDQSFVFPDVPSCREKTEKEQNIQLSHFN